jgi:hypothetical protein
MTALLSGYYINEFGREKAFRYLRQISKKVGFTKAYEVTQANLRGYMLFVEGVVLTPEHIELLDKMNAHHVFAYMPHVFPWREGAENIYEVDEDGFRADATPVVFEPWDVPKENRLRRHDNKEALIEAAKTLVETSNLLIASTDN